MVVTIRFPTYLEDITDIEDDNIDVFVELDDGYIYNVVVATAKNIEYLMDTEKMNYFGPSHPFIIVKKLTKDIIEETLKAYAEEQDGYWLKLYHFAGDINKTVFDKLQAEHIKESEESEELDELKAEYLKEYLKEELKKIDELNRKNGFKGLAEFDEEYLKEDLKKIDELNGLDNS
jgi:hypothetical protein